MQPDRLDAAAQWRGAAAEDLRVARLLQSESPSTAAFHAQQAAEKGLKAAAIAVGDDLPRTHILNDLADELVREGREVSEELRQHLRVLERLYAPTRYPDALGGIDPNRVFVAADAIDAAGRAEIVLAFVDRVIAEVRSLPNGLGDGGD